MGFLSTNWEKRLEQATDLLRRDLPIPALEIAERAAQKVPSELRPRAQALLASARQGVLAAVLSNATEAEAAGDLEDAADWLLSAIEQEPDAVRRAGYETRREELLEQSSSGLRQVDGRVRHETMVVEAGAAETGEESTDVSFRYGTLVSMLSEEVGERYENRPAEFQLAIVQLNEGDAESALPVLTELAADSPEDPILRLELGRARMLSGDAAGASHDLGAAWEGLGDAPLDLHESLFAPALWAEAVLATGDERQVVDRLGPLAESSLAHPAISGPYATALLIAGRTDEARLHLQAILHRYSGDPELHLLAARALEASGDSAGALAGLEQAIAPSCAGGSCARPEPHLPSFRFLARLHLEPGGDPDRARELVAYVADARQGHLESEDLEILADYYRATDNPEAAEQAAAEARLLTNGPPSRDSPS